MQTFAAVMCRRRKAVRVLRQRAVTGAKWTTLSAVFTTALQFTQLAVMAWILTRGDFGLVSMVTVVVGFVQMVGDLGVSNAIIQRQESSQEQLSSLFWLNVITGIILFGAVFLAAPLAGTFFVEPRVTPLVHLAAIGFLISPIGQQIEVLLLKELRFKPLAVIEIGSATSNCIVAVLLALAGAGASAIVWGQLAASALKVCGLVIVGKRHRTIQFRLRYSDVRGYIGFGLYQLGERLVNYSAIRIDVILIGRYLGAEALGAYSLAYQLVLVPLTKINPILTRVAFPVFAKRQSHDALRSGYLEITKLLSIAVFPFLVGLAMTAQPVVYAVLGEKWKVSATLIPMLAVVGIIKALSNPSGIVFLSKGRADIGFWWNVFMLITNAAAFFYAVQFGLYPLVWTYVGLCLIYAICLQSIVRAIVGLTWGSYLSALVPAAAASAIMALAIAAVYAIWPMSEAKIAQAVVLVSIGGLTYISSLYMLNKRYLQDLFKLLRAPKKEV